MKLITQALILVLCAPFPCGAETLAELFEEAWRQDPTLQRAKATEKAALTLIPQTRAALLPNLSGQITESALNTNQPNSPGNYNYQDFLVTLTQPLIQYTAWFNYVKANAQVKRAQAELIAAEQKLILEVAQRYFNTLTAQDNLHFTQAKEKAFAKQLEQARERFNVGLIANTDVQEAQASFDRAHADTIIAEYLLENAFEGLYELVGHEIKYISPLKRNIQFTLPQPGHVEPWLQQAQQENIQLHIARFEVEVRQKEISVQKSGHLPTIALQGTYEHTTTPTFNFLDLEDNTPILARPETSTIGVVISIPVLAGGGVLAKTREAVELFQAAKYQLEATHRAVEKETKDAFRGIESLLSEIQALKQAVNSNEASLEATQAAYEVGTRTIIDVLQVQSLLIDTQQRYARSRYQYFLSSLRLKQAAGLLTSEDIYQINRYIAS